MFSQHYHWFLLRSVFLTDRDVSLNQHTNLEECNICKTRKLNLQLTISATLSTIETTFIVVWMESKRR